MLQDISMYNLPVDYVRGQEKIVSDMTLEQHKALAEKYIDPNRMYYVIAGDAATQMEPLNKIGFQVCKSGVGESDTRELQVP